MNFFDHQRAAKGTTFKLVFLFVAAVVALVAAIDGAAVIAMLYLQAITRRSAPPRFSPWSSS